MTTPGDRGLALVTGGTGFAGGTLVRQLLAEGIAVRVLARSEQRARETLPTGVDVVIGDIRDPAAVSTAVSGARVVYHLASTFRTSKVTDAVHREVHVTGTRNVLDAARAAGTERVVHCSTIGVHGHIPTPPGTETSPFSPGDIYQETKLEAEQLARRYHADHGVPVVIVRPTTMYGPGDLRMLKMFSGIARRRFLILGSGELLLHLVHVNDVVRGFRLAADRPGVEGEAFIVGGDEVQTLNALSATIATIVDAPPPKLRLPVWPFYVAGAVCEAICIPLGVEPPIFRRRVGFYTKQRAFSIEKARRVLGYAPQVRLVDGLRETAGWYREQGLIPG